MRSDHIDHLVCPSCAGGLGLRAAKVVEGSVESGTLDCPNCGRHFPIVRHIPRFVGRDNYATSFGFEWQRHARTQYDSHSGRSISERRFFEETGWSRELTGEMLLEVGSGSGRFTEHAAATGATVVSIDYSEAVEANYASNGSRPNVLIVQADLRRMPLRKDYFDKIFCFGVLQHTPQPAASFAALVPHLKGGGRITVDVYRRLPWYKRFFQAKRWVRPFTSRLAPALLYAVVDRYVRLMWLPSRVINRLPYGKQLNWMLLIADYRGVYELSDDALREWAILDTFDMLSPKFDFPQSATDVERWFQRAGLTDIEVGRGYNGVVGRGAKT